MNLHRVITLGHWQIVIYYSITLQRLLLTLHACSLDIVQLYNCVIAGCVLSLTVSLFNKRIQCNANAMQCNSVYITAQIPVPLLVRVPLLSSQH